MREFFRPWRRKIGMVVLLVSCLFAGGWIRSLSFEDVFILQQSLYQEVSLQLSSGSIACIRRTSDHNGFEDSELRTICKWHSRILHLTDKITVMDKSAVQTISDRGGLGVSMGKFTIPSVGVHLHIWRIAYPSIIIPLTAISAFLLFAKPRQLRPQSLSEPTSESVVNHV